MEKNILVIDDDESIRNSFTLALEDLYHVDTADSGKEGLEKFKKKEYDLLYLDLKMPEMTGVEVLEKIRLQNKTIPIYIVTAFHQEFFEDLQKLAARGISFDLLKKPIGIVDIQEVTQSII